MVARDGVEPPPPAFSATSLSPVLLQQLNSAKWPQFCDHSMTGADVRLASAYFQHGTVKQITTTPVVND